MKKFIAATTLAVLLSTTALAYAEKEIPVDRVILSTSGLANFVHQMQVKDNATVEFPVRFQQVDDILKSLVIFDKKGRLGGVTLPGQQPLAQVFKDLPFSQGQLNNPMLLLNAYQGASVTVKGNSSTMTGKIMHVQPETVVVDDNQTTTKHRLSLMTEAGLRQVLLEDLQSLHFEDEKIRGEIARALDAIRENGTSERRMLTVSLPGEGTRNVTLSYVVDAPLWKTAYRMVVPETGSDKKGLLQGWAVVENMTASDWQNVDMTLVSGNPVTFKQSLYQSYYVSRPELPVQVFGRVMPRVDNGALGNASGGPADDYGMRDEMELDAAPPSPAAAAPMMKMRAARQNAVMNESMAYSSADAPAEMASGGYGGISNVAQAASAAESAEATTQVLFRFPDRFSLKSGQSMMLPFISREIPMERVSLYQPDTHPTHPLAAVEIKNDGSTGLPPGVLTLYEESALLKGTSFVGDASLPVVPQGDKRMLSYALDTKIKIDRENKRKVVEGKISVSHGVMRTAIRTLAETVYIIKAPEKEDRMVVIEHPRMGGYDVISPDPKDVEMTDTHYRIRVPVKAGEKKTLSVVLENKGEQVYGLISMSTAQFVAYANTRGDLDKSTRKAFAKMAEVRKDMDTIDQSIREAERQRNTIFQDQERVRRNLQSLSGTSDIQQKYLRKLNEQEDQVSALDKERDRLAALRLAKEEALKEMIAALTF